MPSRNELEAMLRKAIVETGKSNELIDWQKTADHVSRRFLSYLDAIAERTIILTDFLQTQKGTLVLGSKYPQDVLKGSPINWYLIVYENGTSERNKLQSFSATSTALKFFALAPNEWYSCHTIALRIAKADSVKFTPAHVKIAIVLLSKKIPMIIKRGKGENAEWCLQLDREAVWEK